MGVDDAGIPGSDQAIADSSHEVELISGQVAQLVESADDSAPWREALRSQDFGQHRCFNSAQEREYLGADFRCGHGKSSQDF